MKITSRLLVSALVVAAAVCPALESANASAAIQSGQLVNLYKAGSLVDGSTAFGWSDNVIGSASASDLNAPFTCPQAATGVYLFISQAGSETTKLSWAAYAPSSFATGTKNVLTPNLKISALTSGTPGANAVKTNGGSWSLGLACTENVGSTVDYVAFRTVSITAGSGAWTSTGTLGLTPTPTVTGGTAFGDVLTVQPGTWDQGVSLSYQWVRDSSNIDGATSTTYTLTPADGGHLISAKVTGSATGYSDVTKTSDSKVVALADLTLTPTPTLSGDSVVGDVVTVQPGTWDQGVNLSYQWLRDGSNIDGATSTTYTLTPSDSGHLVSAEVTGSATGYNSVSKTSDSKTVTPAPLTLTAVPTVTGSAKVGSTLTAAAGTWDSGVTFAYQWKRDGIDIAGATGSTYVAKAADVTHTLSVSVTGSKTGYVSETKTSAATAAVAKGTLATFTVAITGTVKTLKTVTAKVSGATSGASFSYQWLLDGKNISKATSSTLKLTAKQKGHKISVKVTEAKTGYTSLVKTSASKKIA